MAVHLYTLSGLTLLMSLLAVQFEFSLQQDDSESEDRRAIMNAMEILLHKQEMLEKKVSSVSEKIQAASADVKKIHVNPKTNDTEADNLIKDLKSKLKTVTTDVKTISDFQTKYLDGEFKRAVDELVKSSKKLNA